MKAGQKKVDAKRLDAAEKALEKMVASAAKAAPKDTAAEPTDAKQKKLEAAVDSKLDMRATHSASSFPGLRMVGSQPATAR